MDGDILDVVTDWGTRSVSDGVDGLYDLVDAEFSGAVTDGTAWAFVLNGRFVGVFDGDIERFEDASLTAHVAPDISLPLLYAMQAGDSEVRAEYYTNETPLSETDQTLSDGNFVGYVELSENVLSGDYYVVYYGGRSLPVAFVGNERRLLTGDEAFDRADDEVGIYSVVDAEVTVVDLPDRPDPVGEGSAAADDADSDAPDVADPVPIEDSDPDQAEDADPDQAEDADPDPAVATEANDPETDVSSGTAADQATDDGADDADPERSTEAAVIRGTDDADGPTPAVDADADDAPATDAVGTPPTPEREDETDPDGGGATDEADVDRLRRELDAAREARAEAEAARDRVASERDEYREEADALGDRIEELEAEIERLRGDADAPPERTLDPEEALSGTNLFVRYEDKTAETVERAAEGRISTDELRANLRLDYHTEFETADVRVDGRSFDDFVRTTAEHRFVEWLLTEVLYEIRRTDTREGVSKLYEAVERIDRIDLDGEVSVEVRDEEQETTTRAMSFDVVCRDKMGDPLFVADFSETREPTAASAIESLLERSTPVGEANASFAAAFFVTTSFFDADAMEVAVDATRGGLFSRSSRRSYVKLSRKHGFHLCLIEARDEEFFLTVPDL